MISYPAHKVAWELENHLEPIRLKYHAHGLDNTFKFAKMLE